MDIPSDWLAKTQIERFAWKAVAKIQHREKSAITP
jgi:hypothetical protein